MTALLNEPAPDFELPDLSGRIHRLSDQRGRIIILNFWSCECPHSERTDPAILSILGSYRTDVALLTIASNRNESAEAIRTVAGLHRLPIVLLDAELKLADFYEAQTTPHVFVIDREGILRYRGAVDDATFRSRIPSRSFLDEALNALLHGTLPPIAKSPAYGCAIVREV